MKSEYELESESKEKRQMLGTPRAKRTEMRMALLMDYSSESL
jgi:hypothetical protein